jgi:antitoxin component of MazEF toxin-antitoxin module
MRYARISQITQDIPMTQVIVGRWGKSLAIRVPLDIAKSAGLSDGEHVEIEQQAGDLIIRRPGAHARARAEAESAAAEIMAESARHSLDGLDIRDLLNEGRRG